MTAYIVASLLELGVPATVNVRTFADDLPFLAVVYNFSYHFSRIQSSPMRCLAWGLSLGTWEILTPRLCSPTPSVWLERPTLEHSCLLSWTTVPFLKVGFYQTTETLTPSVSALMTLTDACARISLVNQDKLSPYIWKPRWSSQGDCVPWL